MIPASVCILGIICMVLHILFGYLLPPDPSPNPYPRRLFIAVVVIVVVLVLWYVAPGLPSVHFGRGA